MPLRKDTFFQKNSKLLALLIGVAMIASAVMLYLHPPDNRAGSEATGQGLTLPFVIVLLILGALIVPSPLHEIGKLYIKSRTNRQEGRTDSPPPAAGDGP